MMLVTKQENKQMFEVLAKMSMAELIETGKANEQAMNKARKASTYAQYKFTVDVVQSEIDMRNNPVNLSDDEILKALGV